MKMDIEGTEHRVWPHLLRTGTSCIVDRVLIEWHGFDQMDGWISMTQNDKCHSRELFHDLKPPPPNDDETHRNDGRPWPSRALCPR